MARPFGGSGWPSFTGAFIVVPPNGDAYADLEVLHRVESFLRKRFPFCEIEVAKVIQPRVETFSVIPAGRKHHHGIEGPSIRRTVEAISRALLDFNPEAPEVKFD